MSVPRLRYRVLLPCLGFGLAVAGMVINAQAASAADTSSTSVSSREMHLQIASNAKQALLVILPYFAERAYSEMRSILEKKGIKVLVASSTVDSMPGYDNKMTVKPDILLSQVRTTEADSIVFIGRARYPGGTMWMQSVLPKRALLKGKYLQQSAVEFSLWSKLIS